MIMVFIVSVKGLLVDNFIQYTDERKLNEHLVEFVDQFHLEDDGHERRK